MKILVVNPNSSEAMTQGMANAIKELDLPETINIETYTAPAASPASIDNGDDIQKSTQVVLDDLTASGKLENYDGVLIACYSVHTLVDRLSQRYYDKLAITGIFEASILTAVSLLPHSASASAPSQWGIVTTGKFWEKHLGDGVSNFLGEAEGSENAKFRGVVSTGLTAGDFHHVSPEEVAAKLVEATKTLLGDGGVGVVAMGCGGMAGLEKTIRETAISQYGPKIGGGIFVVDGVKAGILQLEQMIKSRSVFQKTAA